MTTLIVGCGYLGRVVGQLLVALGEEVIATSRSPERFDGLAKLGLPVVLGLLAALLLWRHVWGA